MDFSQVYDIYYQPVRRFISKMVEDQWIADDLTQDIFIKVQQNFNGLKDPSKLEPWIFRIARNRCLDYFRSGAIQNESHELKDGVKTSIEPLAQIQLEQQQMSRCVQDKIYLLPESLRVVLALADTMDFTHREIANILNISVGNAKVRLHRARKAFKKILQQECTFEQDERSVLVCLPADAADDKGQALGAKTKPRETTKELTTGEL
jgi:RNA polymerase sigma-70 factor (ECF subfamily)